MSSDEGGIRRIHITWKTILNAYRHTFSGESALHERKCLATLRIRINVKKRFATLVFT